MSRPCSQLALEFVRSDVAVSVADLAAAHVDFIDAGTPLIKACGLGMVMWLNKRLPDRLIVTDMKSTDTCRLKAELDYRAGADATTVLGAAARATISGVVEAAEEYKRQVTVDSIGFEDLPGLDAILEKAIGSRLGLVGALDAEAVRKLRTIPRLNSWPSAAPSPRPVTPAAPQRRSMQPCVSNDRCLGSR